MPKNVAFTLERRQPKAQATPKQTDQLTEEQKKELINQLPARPPKGWEDEVLMPLARLRMNVNYSDSQLLTHCMGGTYSMNEIDKIIKDLIDRGVIKALPKNSTDKFRTFWKDYGRPHMFPCVLANWVVGDQRQRSEFLRKLVRVANATYLVRGTTKKIERKGTPVLPIPPMTRICSAASGKKLSQECSSKFLTFFTHARAVEFKPAHVIEGLNRSRDPLGWMRPDSSGIYLSNIRLLTIKKTSHVKINNDRYCYIIDGDTYIYGNYCSWLAAAEIFLNQGSKIQVNSIDGDPKIILKIKRLLGTVHAEQSQP